VLIPTTIGPPGQSYGQRYDFMQMRYSCHYFIDNLLLCVYLRRRILQMRCSFLCGQNSTQCGARPNTKHSQFRQSPTLSIGPSVGFLGPSVAPLMEKPRATTDWRSRPSPV